MNAAPNAPIDGAVTAPEAATIPADPGCHSEWTASRSSEGPTVNAAMHARVGHERSIAINVRANASAHGPIHTGHDSTTPTAHVAIRMTSRNAREPAHWINAI